MAISRQASDDSPPDAGSAAMTRAYVQVLVLEIAIVVALWLFGRMFS